MTSTSPSNPSTPAPPASDRPGALGLILRGICMGAADVVPGVSGGTMAFILGIYDDLIANIRAFTRPPFWRPALQGRIAEAFTAVDWKFLVLLGSGILLAILALSRHIAWLLDNEPILIWSFFFGLVLASIAVVHRRVKRWGGAEILLVILGTVGAYVLVGLVPVTTPTDLWFIFTSGAIAICAMILPGISGSFVLVLLGKYDYILRALNDRDLVTIVVFTSGCAVGILAFSNLLSLLLRRYHDFTIAVLTGFMLGSLRKVWPWKETLQTIVDRHGKQIPIVEENLLPPLYLGETLNGEVMTAIAAALAGFVLVLVLESVAERKERKKLAAG